jgi:hypothetical protein
VCLRVCVCVRRDRPPPPPPPPVVVRCMCTERGTCGWFVSIVLCVWIGGCGLVCGEVFMCVLGSVLLLLLLLLLTESHHAINPCHRRPSPSLLIITPHDSINPYHHSTHEWPAAGGPPAPPPPSCCGAGPESLFSACEFEHRCPALHFVTPFGRVCGWGLWMFCVDVCVCVCVCTLCGWMYVHMHTIDPPPRNTHTIPSQHHPPQPTNQPAKQKPKPQATHSLTHSLTWPITRFKYWSDTPCCC